MAKIMARLFVASFIMRIFYSMLNGQKIKKKKIDIFFIFRFSREIQDIFKGPIFAQVMASTIIICMTCFLLANQQTNVGGFISSIMYLFVMVYQILIFCWVGNEVIYSV